jgi:predicted transcriptional regulator
MSSSTRNAHLHQTLKLREESKRYHWSIDDVFANLLYADLEPMYRLAYDNVTYGVARTSAELADTMSISVPHASTILLHLCEWGMLEREQVTGGKGKYYVYRRKK